MRDRIRALLPGGTLRPLRGRAAVLAALALVVGAGAVAALTRDTGSQAPASRQGAHADASATSTDPTAFVLPNLRSGAPIRLSAFRGTPLVVTLFASWCTACRADLPGFAQLSGHLRGRVAFAGVDSLDGGVGLPFAVALGLGSWPLARDIGGERGSGLHDALGTVGMPATAFYDASGRLLKVVTGSLPLRDLGDEIHGVYGIQVPDLDNN